jgi:hypothetical protein
MKFLTLSLTLALSSLAFAADEKGFLDTLKEKYNELKHQFEQMQRPEFQKTQQPASSRTESAQTADTWEQVKQMLGLSSQPSQARTGSEVTSKQTQAQPSALEQFMKMIGVSPQQQAQKTPQTEETALEKVQRMFGMSTQPESRYQLGARRNTEQQEQPNYLEKIKDILRMYQNEQSVPQK